ncbi:MAG: FAD-dependent monooxygenase [Myxococcales bacterium]|nr:FAD-dependent monooxygenase [Myxococcales bacterium]
MTSLELFVPLSAADEPLSVLAARALGWAPSAVGEVRVVRRALDARKGRPAGFRVRVDVARAGEVLAPRVEPQREPVAWPSGKAPKRVVIVGAGPTGTWAALRLIEAGFAPVIIERGKPVQPRRKDLANLQRGTLNPESNYCFGEGGAGTYSDGKLYTRSKDREGVSRILADLRRFGAPDEIEIEARPHVGSNRLPKVLTALRNHIEAHGGRYRFETTFAGLRSTDGRIVAVRLAGGDEEPADAVVLAVGHSARPVYEWAAATGVPIERKAFALGVRMEHPQPLINQMQYGPAAEHPALPAAFYELKAEASGRGVYSFCMCPGGWIVPAATEEGGVVVNGMSLSRRDSPFANSGFVVTVAPEDFGPAGAGPLAGVNFQRAVEEAAFAAGGGSLKAPAQRVTDFVAGRQSRDVPPSSYRPGLTPYPLSRVLPAAVADALRGGLQHLVSRLPALGHGDGILVGVESRTSAPVRLPRDPLTLQSPGIAGLYPGGEGAGYAGGIVSAALDGVRIAEAILRAG